MKRIYNATVLLIVSMLLAIPTMILSIIPFLICISLLHVGMYVETIILCIAFVIGLFLFLGHESNWFREGLTYVSRNGII